MNLEDFLKLDESDKAVIIETYTNQKRIRNTRDEIQRERKKLSTRELNNQLECDHTDKQTKYHPHENEFGNLTGGGMYYHFCPDCNFRWGTDHD